MTFSGWWWLEPWNFMIFHILGMKNHPNWQTNIFQRGRYTTNQFWMTSPNGCRLFTMVRGVLPMRSIHILPSRSILRSNRDNSGGLYLDGLSKVNSEVNSEDVKKWNWDHLFLSGKPFRNTNFCVSGRQKKTQGVVVPQVPQVPSFDQWQSNLILGISCWSFHIFHAELRYKKMAFPFYKNHQKRNQDAKRCVEKRRVTGFFQCSISCWIQWIWANYNELTATSLESWLIRGIIPKWP